MEYKHGKQFWLVYNRLFKTKTCEMGPIIDSEKKLLCKQRDIAEHLKLTFFGAVHLKNHTFDKDHRQKIEYLQTEVISHCRRRHWIDEFTLTQLKKSLKIVKTSSFDKNLIHPRVLQSSGPNTKLTVLDLLNMYWIESTRSCGTSKIIFVKKADKNPYDIASSFQPELIS